MSSGAKVQVDCGGEESVGAKSDEQQQPQQPQQCYRLNLNEVESTLAAVPENSACLSPAHEPSCCGDSAVHFHIPESNASDFAASECSLAAAAAADQLTKTEALTARQQVALWLTRTSMSDVSSMPSLKSIQLQKKKKKKRRRKPEMERNQSSRSLMGGFSFHLMRRQKEAKQPEQQPEPEKQQQPAMRKCETFTGLRSDSTASLRRQQGQNHQVTAGGKKNHHPSAGQLFRKLSREGSRLHFNGASEGNCSPYPGILPINRLRSSSSLLCSRCTSDFSIGHSQMTSRTASQMSVFQMVSLSRKISAANSLRAAGGGSTKDAAGDEVLCKVCLSDYPPAEMARLSECGCMFCKDCLMRYITFEVMEGAYEISCPDPQCEKQCPALQMAEMEHLVGRELMDRHRTFRLNTEVALDSNRAWCPQVGCETICHICTTTLGGCKSGVGVPVKCPSCQKEFCSLCSASWHPNMTCQENGRALVRRGLGTNTPSTMGDVLMLGSDGGNEIKRCPMCHVPIERNAGCAQMMCKRCKHVFCWFCLTSLDEDFLLRHYDNGACKGRLGHSRASVLWHRAQVIGIFAGFGILLLVASPLLLLAAPCILFCDCKNCHALDHGSSSSAVRSDLDDFAEQGGKKEDGLE